MGRRLIDRKTCGDCGQVVDVLAGGEEVGHGEHPVMPEAQVEAAVPFAGDARGPMVMQSAMTSAATFIDVSTHVPERAPIPAAEDPRPHRRRGPRDG